MKRRSLLAPSDKSGDAHESESRTSSLFKLIKKNKSVLLSDVFKNVNQGGEGNEALRSVITSHRERLYPLGKLFARDGRLELLESFRDLLNSEFGKCEPLGFISLENVPLLQGAKDVFREKLALDLHIFHSQLAKFSTEVVIFRGKVAGRTCDLVLNKKRLKWFTKTCQGGNPGLEKRLAQLIASRSPNSFVEAALSLLLLNPMFLPAQVVIARAFVVIY